MNVLALKIFIEFYLEGLKLMTSRKSKDHSLAFPIENHKTAAWIANWKNVEPESQIVTPSETDVQNAKDWVDTNQL